jgi:hypothetical protein
VRAEAFDLLVSASAVLTESKLSYDIRSIHGVVPTLSPHSGKNNKNLSLLIRLWAWNGFVVRKFLSFFSALAALRSSEAVMRSEPKRKLVFRRKALDAARRPKAADRSRVFFFFST